MIWREKRVLLGVLGVLLLANTAFFFTYRVQYERRLRDLDARLQSAESNLARERGARVAAEQQIAGYQKVQSDLQSLYNERWATEAERFTALVTEIKKSTAASQLIPRAINFSEAIETAKESGIVGTSTVHITFSVQGSYQQIRRLINLLELSDQFVIIDGISLGGGSGNNLTLNLRLKTIFRAAPRGAMTNREAQRTLDASWTG